MRFFLVVKIDAGFGAQSATAIAAYGTITFLNENLFPQERGKINFAIAIYIKRAYVGVGRRGEEFSDVQLKQMIKSLEATVAFPRMANFQCTLYKDTLFCAGQDQITCK